MDIKELQVRFCPSCGLVGEVEKKYRNCCPDWRNARIVPAPFAEKCRQLFVAALDQMSRPNPAPAPEVEPVTVIGGFLQQDPSTIPTTDEHNALLVEQIEEIREALDAHRDNAHKLVELNHKIITENATMVNKLQDIATSWRTGVIDGTNAMVEITVALDKVKP